MRHFWSVKIILSLLGSSSKMLLLLHFLCWLESWDKTDDCPLQHFYRRVDGIKICYHVDVDKGRDFFKRPMDDSVSFISPSSISDVGNWVDNELIWAYALSWRLHPFLINACLDVREWMLKSFCFKNITTHNTWCQILTISLLFLYTSL